MLGAEESTPRLLPSGPQEDERNGASGEEEGEASASFQAVTGEGLPRPAAKVGLGFRV